MDVVCVIGERLYHRSGSECHARLEAQATGPLLAITDAQAHENGMEPCGFCLAGMSEQAPRARRDTE